MLTRLFKVAGVFIFLTIIAPLAFASASCLPSKLVGPCYQGKDSVVKYLTLDKLDLSGADFFRGYLIQINFASVTIQDANFRQAHLRNFRADYSRWRRVDLRGMVGDELRLKNYSFEEANFSGAKISNSHFTGGDFKNSTFKDAYFIDSEFKDCVLPQNFRKQAILINVKIENCREL